jgi:subtilisin family serine protease
MNRSIVPITAFVVFVLTIPAAAQTGSSGSPAAGSEPFGLGTPGRHPQLIPGQFIVELHPGAPQDDVLRAHGLVARARWRIVNGFVARMSDAAANRLRSDPSVRSVSPDVVVSAFPKPPSSGGGGGGGGKGKGGGSTSPPACPDTSAALSLVPEQVPTGVQRIGAANSPLAGAGVKVAVLDTGIDDCHPDLKDNVKGGTNVVDSTKPPRDDNGHGTHVAGIVAARPNDFGVVGVAPGAALYAVKVLDAAGSGALSNVITGLDWAVTNGMKVANLSLGAPDFWCVLLGLCGAGTECTAVNNAVTRGVTVVVAAGNDATDAVFSTPANCRDSLTVTALADSDGGSGGLGPDLAVGGQPELDDTFAQTFSNFSVFGWDVNGDGLFTVEDHPVVDLMAPGVAILSTLPTFPVTLNTQYGLPLNYAILSGTSMATPHVAGTAARYIAAHPGASADAVRQALVLSGECASAAPVTGLLCSTKWPDDPDVDSGSEPLVHISGF